LKTKDCSGAFRCYRTSRLAQLDFDANMFEGVLVSGRDPLAPEATGLPVGETPIVFADRVYGQSKDQPSEAWRALRIIFTLGCRSIVS